MNHHDQGRSPEDIRLHKTGLEADSTRLNEPTPVDDPRVIRENIERTRLQMSETINRIQNRLDPDRLRHEAEEAVRDATIGKVEEMAYRAKYKAQETQRGLVQKVKENPIPAALIGLGLGWLMMSGNRHEEEYGYDPYDYRYGRDVQRGSGYGNYDYRSQWEGRNARPAGQRPENYSEYVTSGASQGYPGQGRQEFSSYTPESHEESLTDEVRSRVNEVAHDVQDQVSHLRDQVREGTSYAGEQIHEGADYLREQARRQSYQAQHQFNNAMNQNPLAVGALALAAGALIGLAVPSTPVENEWMGETRDRFIHDAEEVVKAKAEETVERLKNVAQETQSAAKEAVREQTGNDKSPMNNNDKSSANNDANKLKQTTPQARDLTNTAKG